MDNKTYTYKFKSIKKPCQKGPHVGAEGRDGCPVPKGANVCGHVWRRVILVRSARAAGIPSRPKKKRGLREVSLQGTQDRVELGQHTAYSSLR